MSKELEAFSKEKQALDELYDVAGNIRNLKEEYMILKQALQRLEAIEKANSSEALECLEKLKGMEISSMPFSDEYGTQEVDLNDIRKVGSQLNTDFREYTTIIKQTLILAEKEHNSVNLLMQELDCKDFADLRKYARCGYQTFRNAEKEHKALEIIKEKLVDVFRFKKLDFNTFNQLQRSCKLPELTEEEFDLLKEVLEE